MPVGLRPGPFLYLGEPPVPGGLEQALVRPDQEVRRTKESFEPSPEA